MRERFKNLLIIKALESMKYLVFIYYDTVIAEINKIKKKLNKLRYFFIKLIFTCKHYNNTELNRLSELFIIVLLLL